MGNRAVMAYDQLDILFFDQGSQQVEAYDAKSNNVTTTGVSTETLDLVGKSYLGNSIYVADRADYAGTFIGGTGNPKIVATLLSGSTAGSENVTHVIAHQTQVGEVLEIPLPQTVGRFIKVGVKSNGGGDSNAIVTGAIQVFIAKSGGLT